MPLVLAFCNPVLDSVVKLKNKDILHKFKLQEDGHKETSFDEMTDIIKEVQKQKYAWKHVAGGSALNTIRILQWLFKSEPATVVFGAVGLDTNATRLKNIVQEFGVQTKFTFIERQPTGWVLSLVHQATRSLVANIGAAQSYAVKHFDSHENRKLIKDCSLLYMEGFFITQRREVSRQILAECKEANKPFVFNLNAEYLLLQFRDEILHFVEHANILFGNHEEFNELAKAYNKTREELIKMLLEKESNKLMVITNGPSVILAYYWNEEVKYEVPQMKETDIVDTTGCGDSFAAGFLYGYLQDLDPLTCVKWGTWMAQHVIRQIGCTPPDGISPDEIKNVK